MARFDFPSAFQLLTGYPPYAWQERLYREWFSLGKIPPSIQLPTGTGKTRIMAIWLLSLAGGAPLPKRIVWVVDRRVVVDQATSEAERLRKNLLNSTQNPVREALNEQSVSASDGGAPFAISTLRGDFEDNRSWTEDPSRPAIIIGTVDMVGSRLLFSGYGDGRYYRPFHAGLLGRDALVVLDEAHLSRSFGALLREVESLQAQQGGVLPPFRFLPLSATLGSEEGRSFSLLPSDRDNKALGRILQAPKRLVWHSAPGNALSTEEFRAGILKRAKEYGKHTERVIVFLDRLTDLSPVLAGLSREFRNRTVALTGTMRGRERDQLVANPVFSRFLKPLDGGEGPAFLVSTSAGEVGTDLYADQMICDLVPVERMVQRFGRVNRAGNGRATVDIYPRREEAARARRHGLSGDPGADRTAKLREAVGQTEVYLRSLDGVSPAELGRSPLPGTAFGPVPASPPLRTWLLDAWSLTTNPRQGLPVGRWLRGLGEEVSPDVYFAWRDEVETLATATLLDDEDVDAVFAAYRLLPRELLRQDIRAAGEQLKALDARAPDTKVVILSPSSEVEFRGRLHDFMQTPVGRRPALRTVVLPTNVGGLDEHGMMDASVEQLVTDVSPFASPDRGPTGNLADESISPSPGPEPREHGRLRENEEGQWELTLFGREDRWEGGSREDALRKARTSTGLRSVFSIALHPSSDNSARRALVYLRAQPEPGTPSDLREMTLSEHLARTAREMDAIARKLGLMAPLAALLVEAARDHDLGKARRRWQEYAGNTNSSSPVAKSTHYRSPATLGGYRHELGSIIDLGAQRDPLVLHLIAAHHGYARPDFPGRAWDRDHPAESHHECLSQLKRFAAMQREYGWWGLAYLEALLKTADARGST